MINISDAAQIHFSNLLSSQEEGTQIRIFVTNPGTSKAECGVSYCHLNNIKKTDIALKFDKLIVYIDELSAPYLKDAEIDLYKDHLNSQLILKAPYATALPKVDDSAPLIDRVRYLLQSQINPLLAEHGGQVILIDITDDNYVVLQFMGGCNGCSMVDFTLKHGIEKQLLDNFPELKGVRDDTNHQYGNHSYY